MTDPLKTTGVGAGAEVGGAFRPAGGGAVREKDLSFHRMLLDSLDEVNRLQGEAAQGVEKLLTGQIENPDEVFSTVRKAEVAFSLLMEIRNKLLEAYEQLQQMRV